MVGRGKAASSWLTPGEAGSLPHYPCAAYILSPQNSISWRRGGEGSSQSLFTPSRCAFTALLLSLATWFPCPALLCCLYPRLFNLPGPRTSCQEESPLTLAHPTYCPLHPHPLL